jgi:hypothetical protein
MSADSLLSDTLGGEDGGGKRSAPGSLRDSHELGDALRAVAGLPGSRLRSSPQVVTAADQLAAVLPDLAVTAQVVPPMT